MANKYITFGSGSTIVDNLTTDDGSAAISAKSGKKLKQILDQIPSAPEIVNNLTTNDSTKVLSAEQGKLLNTRIPKLVSTLDSDSTIDVLSARAAYTLNASLNVNTPSENFNVNEEMLLNAITIGPWITRRIVTGGGTFLTIAFSEELGLFCAPMYNSFKVVLSSDGYLWSTANLPTSAYWDCIRWAKNAGKFIVFAGNRNQVAISSDGMNWTQHQLPSNTAAWKTVGYSDDLNMFLVLSNGTQYVATSTDGAEWTAHDVLSSELRVNWNDVCWAPELGKFCAVSMNSNKSMVSSDGLTWEGGTLPVSAQYYFICYSPHLRRFLTLPYGHNKSCVSDDGINWTISENLPKHRDGGNYNMFSMFWNEYHKVFCLFSTSYPMIMISKDGLNWDVLDDGSPIGYTWWNAAWSNSLNRMVGVSYAQAMSLVGTLPPIPA